MLEPLATPISTFQTWRLHERPNPQAIFELSVFQQIENTISLCMLTDEGDVARCSRSSILQLGSNQRRQRVARAPLWFAGESQIHARNTCSSDRQWMLIVYPVVNLFQIHIFADPTSISPRSPRGSGRFWSTSLQDPVVTVSTRDLDWSWICVYIHIRIIHIYIY